MSLGLIAISVLQKSALKVSVLYFGDKPDTPGVPPSLKFRVQKNIHHLERMKKIFSIKRVVILAAVICVLATATVFAAGGITHYTSSSYRGNAYTKIPSADKLSKDIGFTPKIIAAFSNGYAFKDAEPVGTNGQSEENQNLTSFKELSTTYCAPDGKSVTLTS